MSALPVDVAPRTRHDRLADVRAALSTVLDPELDEPITDLGFVRSVALGEQDDLEVHLRLPTSFCSPNFAYLMASDAKDALVAVPWTRKVVVALDDHHDSDKINAGLAADAGYRGHNAPLSHRFKVYTSGQKRRMTPAIKREMRRRSAVEPVIGHIKNGHRMNRNYLAGPQGDAINAILATAGYNFRLLLNWLRLLLCLIAGLILLRSSRANRLQIA